LDVTEIHALAQGRGCLASSDFVVLVAGGFNGLPPASVSADLSLHPVLPPYFPHVNSNEAHAGIDKTTSCLPLKDPRTEVDVEDLANYGQVDPIRWMIVLAGQPVGYDKEGLCVGFVPNCFLLTASNPKNKTNID